MTTITPIPSRFQQPPDPDPVPRRGPAAWCAQHRWRTLLAAVLVLAGAVVLLGGGLRTTAPADQLVGDSRDAVKISAGVDFGTRPTESVVATRPDGAFPPQEAAALGAQLRKAYLGLPGVATVGTPTPSPDRRTIILAVGLDAVSSPETASGVNGTKPGEVVGPMLAATRQLAATHPQLRIGQVGPGSIDSEVRKQLDADFRRAELVSLPVTLGVLLVAFGAVVAAGVPVLLGIGAVISALGLTALASRQITPVDQNTQSLVLLIGLAVGVDYALFVLRRSREERVFKLNKNDCVIAA